MDNRGLKAKILSLYSQKNQYIYIPFGIKIILVLYSSDNSHKATTDQFSHHYSYPPWRRTIHTVSAPFFYWNIYGLPVLPLSSSSAISVRGHYFYPCRVSWRYLPRTFCNKSPYCFNFINRKIYNGTV